MAVQTLLDCKVFLGGYNLSGYHNSIDMSYGAEMLDDTVFGTSGTRSSKPGLKTFEFNGNIFWDPAIDGVVFTRIGATREVMSFSMDGNTAGDIGYTVRAVNGTYNPLSGEVGALLASEFSGKSSDTPLVRGRVMIPLGARTATGTGTIVQVGAAAAGQRIYAALHVVSVSGTTPSFTATVKSAAAVGFASPVNRLVFSAANAIGAQWMEMAGPVTDQYWRVDWTISGTSPNFNAFLVLGIQ
jgi:hypothetical protein